MDVNHALLNVLANETILIVCQALDDNDLLTLCQVSKRLHTLSLDTYFLRHGISEADIMAGNILVSSNSLCGVRHALFISSIEKLSCIFHRTTAVSDMSAMERFVSRLPPIKEVEVTIDVMSTMFWDRSPTEAFISLLLALLPDKFGTILFLKSGSFHVSNHRRFVQRFMCLILFGPFIVAFGAINLASLVKSIIIDPRARLRQDHRIREDLLGSSMWTPPHSLQVRSPMLPDPPFAKWTMITFNSSTMTTLNITNIPLLPANWRTVLPSIHLPSLRRLGIGRDVELDFCDFSAFVCRHPKIDALSIDHFSIPYRSLAPFPANSLPKLSFLAATARHVTHILRSAEDFRHLRQVDIGPEQFKSRSSRQLDHKAKVETPFSFDDLNEALRAVADLHIPDFTLTVIVPGDSRSKQWLSLFGDDRDTQRVERRLHNFTIVNFHLERGKRLHPSMHALLSQWLGLFPSVRKIWITGISSVSSSVHLVSSIRRVCPHVGDLQLSLVRPCSDFAVGV